MSLPPLAQRLIPWLVREGLVSTGLEATFDAFCRRLVEGGVPLARGHLALPTLHPTIEGFGLTWRPTGGTDAAAWNFDNDPSAFEDSPFYRLIRDRETRLRRRLDGNAAVVDFPILHEFKAEGITDYYVTLEAFGDVATKDFETDPLPGVAASWSTACCRSWRWSPIACR
jgi:adenylate cyclase